MKNLRKIRKQKIEKQLTEQRIAKFGAGSEISDKLLSFLEGESTSEQFEQDLAMLDGLRSRLSESKSVPEEVSLA